MKIKLLLGLAVVLASVTAGHACMGLRVTREQGKLMILNYHYADSKPMTEREASKYWRTVKDKEVTKWKEKGVLVTGDNLEDLRRVERLLGAAGYRQVQLLVADGNGPATNAVPVAPKPPKK